MARIHFALACAAFALPTAPAFAASSDEAADNSADRAIIVTGARASSAAAQAAASTPGGTDVVTYADYADKSLVSLRDTLAFSPGIYTQPRYGQEVRISIRGSGISRGYHMRGLTLLQDGVPINLADDNGDFQELEPAFFDHLEIYRGANALRFGSGTLGGAINGVTPRGQDAPGLYLRADTGSFDLIRGLVSYGGASGPADFWAGISADTSDGDRDHAKRRSLRFHGNVGLKLSDTVATRFYASINAIEQELPGALTLDEALTHPAKGNFAGDQQRNITSLRLQNRISFTWDNTALTVGLFTNTKQLFHPIYEVIDQKSADLGAFARLTHAAGPWEFTLGGEIRHGDTRARQFRNVNGKRGALTFDADLEARTANIYGEVRLRPLPGLSLIAGAIYADGFRKRTVNFAPSPAPDGRIAFDSFSPKFGLLYEPTPDIQFYANYSRSAEFPGFGEVFQTANRVNIFVSDIRPQRAWTAEVGTRGKAGWVTWDVSLYRANIKGEMLQYTVSSDIPAGTFNAGKTRHQGVEFGLTLEPTDWLRFRQSWQYADFHFRKDASFVNNHLPVVPRHVLRSELRLGRDALHISPNLEWVPQGPWADYSNTMRTPGYALIGVSGGAALTDNIDLFFDLRNLTGKRAIGDISAVISATPSSAIYYPVERRAIYGGVRARF